MRRLVGILVGLAVVVVAVVVIAGAGGDDKEAGSYKVRTIFRNAFSIIPGEDVKVAGVKVGKIDSLDVTPDKRAAVVLDITEKGFQSFRTDAECTIRPQSLIGEKFVECTPTEPRAENAQAPPELERITSGKGKGQYGPLTRTRQQVDIDLAANTLRMPYRQRLSLILNEFGIALAGRGEDLNQVIRNADPALAETDKVLGIIAKQNGVLAKLADDSDTILTPLAREKQRVTGFVENTDEVNQATAERSADLEANLQKLPAFLRQLRPTMARLGALSDQATPVLSDLGRQAPSINRLIKQTGPFSEAATPSVKTLGAASVPGREALNESLPIIRDLRSFAGQLKPLSTNLEALTTSLRNTGGIERLMDFAFYQAAAVNGYDAYGHYLRAQLVVNLCSTYATTADAACISKFGGDDAAARSTRAASAERDPVLARTDAVLRGMSPAQALARFPDAATAAAAAKGDSAEPRATSKTTSSPSPAAASAPAAAPTPTPAQAPATTAPQPQTPAPAQDAEGGLLDYLLGSGT